MAKKRMQTKSKSQFNTKWFKANLERCGLSQASLGRETGIPREYFSKMISGERDMRFDEAVALAKIFKVPIAEVAEMCGISARGVPSTTPQATAVNLVEVKGLINDEFNVVYGPVRGSNAVPHPQTPPQPSTGTRGSSEAVIAFRLQTAGGRLDGLDGGIVYVSAEMSDEMPADQKRILECIGRLSLVRDPRACWHFGVVRRGYDENRFNLAALSGEVIREGLILEVGLPVLWLKL